MDLFYVTLGYLSLVPILLFVLLFGEHPSLRRTPVSWAHWLLTDAIWSAFEWLLVKLCGSRGQRCLNGVLECLCDKPHPLLQVSYLLIIGFCYYLYAVHVFVLLPNPWVSEIHIPLSVLTTGAAITSFIIASRSNPGIITSTDLPAHHALYALDNVLWKPKHCITCGWSRPARSKHCRVCGYCIARHDHHCGWINNCVGLYNHRWFLLFLMTNLGLAVYGAAVGGCVMLGEADRAGILRHKVFDYHTDQVKLVYLPAQQVTRWLVVWFSLPFAITLFMAAASLLLLLFIAYQAYLISAGKTQYEVHRMREVQAMLKAEAELSSDDDDDDNAGYDGDRAAAGASTAAAAGKNLKHGTTSPGRQNQGNGTAGLGKNAYNRGFVHNWSEVLFPLYHLRKAYKESKRKSK